MVIIMHKYEGKWTTDNSDLYIVIHKVFYVGKEYIKCKMSLINKRNGIVYDRNKGHKFHFKNIKHWKRYSE